MKKENGGIKIMMFDKIEDIISPNDLEIREKNLIIFDDCMNNKNQEIIKKYFSKGRHSNVNCVYLSQSFFELDRKTIRGNLIFLYYLNYRKKICR